MNLNKKTLQAKKSGRLFFLKSLFDLVVFYIYLWYSITYMSTVFILALSGYLFSFLYNTFSNSIDDTIYTYQNIKTRKFSNSIAISTYIYNKLKQLINIQASYLKINKYLFISILVHIIALFFSTQYIIFKSIKNNENWIYTDMTQKDIEEKTIADSAPEDTLTFEEPQTVENSEENDSNSSISVGIKEYSDTTEIPVDNIALSIPPIITSSASKTKIKFKTEASSMKLKFGKYISYEEGKISGIDGYGLDGEGSSLTGRGSGKGTGGKGLTEGKIFGDNIKANRLGVILDNSLSMEPYLNPLKAEISKKFNNAKIIEVYGCEISTSSEPLFAFKTLAQKEVDTIYWFCDLQDYRTSEGLEVLAKILTNKNIKLYIKTMDKTPNRELQLLIRATGGECFVGLN